jgi:protein-L-isoaspartate(D-aspartate) O-methyltransferase
MTLTENRPAAASDAARRAMIDSQLRTSGINEPWVLAAMARVPRVDFVPDNAKAAAYTDRAVPLGNGRFLAAPVVQGLMLTEARPTVADKALLVGDGRGYLAALLGPLTGSLDAVDPAQASARRRKGPYSLIVIDGAIEELPAALCAQLEEGGRVVTGLVLRGVTRLATGRKAAREVTLLPLAEIGIPVLPELAAPKRWSF